MTELETMYKLKDKADAPDRYLSANIDKVQLSDDTVEWSRASYKYITNPIKNLEEQRAKESSKLL